MTGDFRNGNAFNPVFQGFRDRGFSTAENSDGRTPYTHPQDTKTCPPTPGEVGNKPDYIWTNLAPTDRFAPCWRSGTSDHFPLVAEFDWTATGDGVAFGGPPAEDPLSTRSRRG